MGQSEIVVRGARENNLKNVNVAIPRGSLTTITGVSGSGKSSLAFETIHNEGQRRFLESLSSYARQFMGQIEKPDVDHVEGLSPTVSIDQKTVNRNPRSTVGTITEVHDHLRLLFARLGTPECPECGAEIKPQTVDQIRDSLLRDHAGSQVVVLAPLVKDRKGSYRKELEDLRLKGYVRARIDGEIRRLDDDVKLERYVRHTIEAVIDRVRLEEAKKSRLAEALEQAIDLADGHVNALIDDEHQRFSTRNACIACGRSFPDLEPRLFSFNSPHGACPTCDGLGETRDVDPDLVVPDGSMTLADGALAPFATSDWRELGGLSRKSLPSVAKHFGFDLETPWNELEENVRSILLEGSDGEEVKVIATYEGKNWKVKSSKKKAIVGVLPGIRAYYAKNGSRYLERYMSVMSCHDCGGARVNRTARSVRFRGHTLPELSTLPIDELFEFVEALEFTGREEKIGRPIVKELGDRLRFLVAVGLGYITAERSAATLSGGESQRIRLATQVGSRLKGILYVLDEPSIGLHARDNDRLIETLCELRDLGNTVCVVEHDQEMMERSDWVIDVGPGAGVHGGEIVFEGTCAALRRHPDSATGGYLSGRLSIPVPAARRAPGEEWLTVVGASHNNLRGIDVAFPVGLFTVVTGVSGSGKSSLVDDTLKRALAAHYHNAEQRPGKHVRMEGLDAFDKVIEIDQSPIGRTPRSNPATYTKVFDLIRELFAQVPEARARGYKKGRFSFNVKGGRCEGCSGAGVKLVSMQFLPDVEVVCDDCASQRFNPETLEIRYRDKSIHDVLEMTVEDAAAFFVKHPKIKRTFDALLSVGLDYVRLGQTATTLSGGEAQRVKLASELRRPATGRTLYLLDEPTTGLHFQDIEKLLEALQDLVTAGNTVIVIEHNLDVVKVADYVIDLGPEGGSGGGDVVYAGPYDGLVDHPVSHTAASLRRLLGGARPKGRRRRKIPDLSTEGEIVVRGARTHNLAGVDVHIPTAKITVVTGPSGSGKTSLAFDTIFAEGQRRFVESLSAYARQFLGRMEKAPVDRIDGLAPAIAINQKNVSRNPRSTLATTTEIYDYLRLLYARIGRPHCPDCGVPLKAWSPSDTWKDVKRRFDGTKGRLVAPLFSRSLGEVGRLDKPTALRGLAKTLREAGWMRVLIDGEEFRLDGKLPALTGAKEIWLVVDRVAISAKARPRVLEAVAAAFEEGLGLCGWSGVDGETAWYTRRRRCVEHGNELEDELSPRQFSFNHQSGSCGECHGLGVVQRCDPDLLVNQPERSVLKGGMKNKPGVFFVRKAYFRRVIRSLGKERGFDPEAPWEELDEADRDVIMRGSDERVPFKSRRTRKGESSSVEMNVTWPGLCGYVERWFHETDSEGWREKLHSVMRVDHCPSCGGRRLRPQSLAVTVGRKGIHEVTAMTVRQAFEFFEKLKLTKTEKKIAERPVKEVHDRLRFLDQVGLEYLTLDRSAGTLSGGEAQRIRLATQIGSRLSGVLYVLDEPTIGLHQRDVDRLLGTLEELRELGNTVILVEHDEETMERADWIVDLGPGAGHHGGRIMFSGTRADLLDDPDSVTAAYLSGRRSIEVPAARREGNGKSIVLRGCRTNNLKGVDVEFPLGSFVGVTGVSGSGKSSLVVDTLVPALESTVRKASLGGAEFDRIEGARWVSDLIVIDQAPIGRTPKSNPVTYAGCFDAIRQVFSSAPAARMKGFKPGRFSFNAIGGRCEACSGRGSIKVEMNFLADVWITCDVCRGRRYNSETLTVQYRGKTIADVLELEVADAAEFFANHKRISRVLQTLVDVGLGYLKLGQPSNTLSGGEAQRIKLSRELARPARERNLYVLDEPTTGLHFDDVEKLIRVLHRLVEQGHTVVVIEHNLDVIWSCDHVIDLGLEGGADGGEIVVTGTPEEIIVDATSHTGRYLAEHARRRGWKKSRAATKGKGKRKKRDGIPA